MNGDEADQGNEDQGTDGPCLDAMECGPAEVLSEFQRIFPEPVQKLGNRKTDQRSIVEHLAKADIDQNERQMDGVGEGFEKVKDRLVQPKEVTDEQADDRGGSHDGKHSQGHTERDAP